MSEPISDSDLDIARREIAEGCTNYWAKALLAEVHRLRAENDTLRNLHEARCERVAAAHEVIAARAERDALGRLEAWQAEERDYRAYEVRQYRVLLVEDTHASVVAYRCPSERSDYGSRRDDPACIAVAGTDDKPATIAECILAALELWAEQYESLTADEVAELNRLHDESLRRREQDGGDWEDDESNGA